ncbi:class I SAM-dependent methyltransferase [Candidatus Woesebacteria bacterium]|nr:class I SAM-dependent methyltransferase [Candidatus Woesebacteria bacterium]
MFSINQIYLNLDRHLSYAELLNFLKHDKQSLSQAKKHLDVCRDCWDIWNKVRWDSCMNSVGVSELKEYLGDQFIPYFDSSVSLAVNWYNSEPKTPEEVAEFYKNTHDYIYNLVIWHESGDREDFLSEFKQLSEKYGVSSFLDYGCGVGNDGLALINSGYSVSFVDYSCPSTDFLLWRMKKRGIHSEIIDIEKNEILPSADVFFAIDVLEHIQDPLQVLKKINNKTKIFAHRSQFGNKAGGRHPFHFDFDESSLNEELVRMGFHKIESKYLSSWLRQTD